MSNLHETIITKTCKKTGFGKITHGSKSLLAKNAYLDEKISYTLTKNKKGIENINIIEPNIHRVQTTCQHFHECGGCALLGQSIDAQKRWKEDIVQELFSSDQSVIKPLLSNPKPNHYRNKVELTFSQNLAGDKKLGFIQFGSKGFAFSMNECKLIPHWMLTIKNITEDLFKNSAVEAFYLPKMKGVLKNLLLRSNADQSEILVALVIQDFEMIPQDFLVLWQEKIIESLNEQQALSLYLIEQKVQKGSPTTLKEKHLYGNPVLNQMMSFDLLGEIFDLHFQIRPLSFFQPNPFAAKIIYETAIEKLHLTQSDVVLDLYCGTGTFGMIASKFSKEVIGIEINESAIKDGNELLIKNSIGNMHLFLGDAKEEIGKFLSLGVNKIIVDPPRAGLDKSVIEAIYKIAPEKVVYISCNPLTQKTDIEYFKELGFAVVEIIPIDQFTHTPHLENIVVLKNSQKN